MRTSRAPSALLGPIMHQQIEAVPSRFCKTQAFVEALGRIRILDVAAEQSIRSPGLVDELPYE